MGEFGTYRSGPGQLIEPLGIAIDNPTTGLVYVSEKSCNRISIFTSDGVFVRCFGRKGKEIDQFSDPCGLAFNKDGFLYVCDYTNCRLVVY